MKAPTQQEARVLLQVAAHPAGLRWTRAVELGLSTAILETLVAKGLVTNSRGRVKIVKAAEKFVL